MNAQLKVKPKPIQDALTFKEVVERSVGLPYHEVNYMTGKDLRDRVDRLVLEAYIQSKTFTDQCYTNTNKTIRITKKIVKVNKKWTQEPIQVQQEQGFKFTVPSHTITTRTKENTLFVFGAGSGTAQAKIISKEEDRDKELKETRKHNKSKNSK